MTWTVQRVFLRPLLIWLQQRIIRIENPVTRAKGQLNLLQHATPEQQVILGEIQAITARLDAIERRQPFQEKLSGTVGLTANADVVTLKYPKIPFGFTIDPQTIRKK